MTTETKLNKLTEYMDKEYRRARIALQEVREARERAKDLSVILPQSVLDTEWWCFRHEGDHKWYMETRTIAEPNEADKLVRELKLAGVYAIKSHHNQYSDRWVYEGKFLMGDDIVTIRVDGGSKPPTCHVEKVVEVKEVITYKAICEETGDEL